MHTLSIRTHKQFECINITSQIQKLIKDAGVKKWNCNNLLSTHNSSDYY